MHFGEDNYASLHGTNVALWQFKMVSQMAVQHRILSRGPSFTEMSSRGWVKHESRVI